MHGLRSFSGASWGRKHDHRALPLLLPVSDHPDLRPTATTLNARLPANLADLLDDAPTLAGRVDPFRPVLCHNDLLPANLIDEGERLWLVDWEYAGMGHPLFDLASVSANAGLHADEDARLLAAYRGEALAREPREIGIFKAASALREALWALIQSVASELDFDYHAYAEANSRLTHGLARLFMTSEIGLTSTIGTRGPWSRPLTRAQPDRLFTIFRQVSQNIRFQIHRIWSSRCMTRAAWKIDPRTWSLYPFGIAMSLLQADPSSKPKFDNNGQYSRTSILRYEKIFGEHYISTGGAETTDNLCKRLGSSLRPGVRVLDVGSGIGGAAFHLARDVRGQGHRDRPGRGDGGHRPRAGDGAGHRR